jgi:uncharacterized sulfatase
MSRKNLNRRDFLKSIGMLTATSAALPGCKSIFRQASTARKRPRLNILWISCEDISPHLGCYGDDYADTPNLDRLARQGCRYTNAFVPYPVCAPTRSAVITAMYPSTIGSMHMRTNLKGYQTVPAAPIKAKPITSSAHLSPPGTSRITAPTGETAQRICRFSA